MVKREFNEIYAGGYWGDKKSQGHGGSGSGSTIKYTVNARNILYTVIRKYNIESMLDAPCGSMSWMPVLLRNLSQITNKRFRYHGIDVVETIVRKSQIKYANKRLYPNWRMSVVDFSRQPVPNGYDLIFSRDALQHLTLDLVVDSLERFAHAQGSRYLLVGSYLLAGNASNVWITSIGEYFPINLTESPFLLTEFIDQFAERDKFQKHLILYDVPNYLRHFDFAAMRERVRLLAPVKQEWLSATETTTTTTTKDINVSYFLYLFYK